ncbi:MAG: hypothetical protein OEM07_00485 [Gammaproteobacteria bacterium]|nr:hypothetical protein [Gammaproteobacteria bacterium]
MKHSYILIYCSICLFVAGCDKQEPPAPVTKNPEIKIVPQKDNAILDLSIDNIPVEVQPDNEAFFLNERKPTEEKSQLFKKLSQDKVDSKVNISGKLLTDEEKINNKDYLDSVEGMQINIEGEFK